MDEDTADKEPSVCCTKHSSCLVLAQWSRGGKIKAWLSKTKTRSAFYWSSV